MQNSKTGPGIPDKRHKNPSISKVWGWMTILGTLAYAVGIYWKPENMMYTADWYHRFDGNQYLDMMVMLIANR